MNKYDMKKATNMKGMTDCLKYVHNQQENCGKSFCRPNAEKLESNVDS